MLEKFSVLDHHVEHEFAAVEDQVENLKVKISNFEKQIKEGTVMEVKDITTGKFDIRSGEIDAIVKKVIAYS